MMRILSAVDFLKLLIYWLPTTIIAASLGLFINYADATARFRAVQMHGDEGLSAWKAPDKWMDRLRVFILLATIIGIPFLNIRNLPMLQLAVYILVGYVIAKLTMSKILPLSVRPQDTWFFYASILLLIITAVFGGVGAAIKDIDRQAPVHVVETPAGQFRVVIMRYIDKGIMYHFEGDNRLTFTPWDKIVLVKSDAIVLSDRRLYRWVYDLFGSRVAEDKSKQ